MYTLQLDDTRGPDHLDWVQIDEPSPGPGQVRVRVGAAGINYADLLQSYGRYGDGSDQPLPFRPGLEFAGTVEAVGDGVERWREGDRVMGLQMGCFAEKVVAPAEALSATPESWSDATAAAYQIHWQTAHACLCLLGGLQRGQHVLVHAAAGGVGLAAVRLAAHLGATVSGTASSADKLAVARAEGLHHGIDTSTDDLLERGRQITGGRGYDVVLEMVGGDVFSTNVRLTRPYGRLIVYGAASMQRAQIDNLRLIFRPIQVIGYHLMQLRLRRPDLWAEQQQALEPLIRSGVVAPKVGARWPMSQAADAYRALEARTTTGKQVLVP
jgi:NADPH2:quinone reductase